MAINVWLKSKMNTTREEIIEDDVVTASEYAENLVRYGNAAQLMTAKKGLDTKGRELLTLKTVVEPVENDYMMFLPYGDFCKEKKLGMLETTRTVYRLVDIPNFVRINEEISLTLEALHETSQIKCNEKIKQVDAVVTSPDNVKEKMTVVNNENGTLSVRTRAKIQGEHEVSIHINQKQVKGSPFRIQVIRKKGLVCTIPGEGQLPYTYGVTLTRTGDVLACHHGCRGLLPFSMEGKFLNTITYGKLSRKPGLYDAAVTANGNIFCADNSGKQVIVFSEEGKVIKRFGTIDRSYCGIAVSPVNGRVYVTDRSLNRIFIYDRDGKVVKSFGQAGTKPGEFSNPGLICTDSEGNVYAPDSGNHRHREQMKGPWGGEEGFLCATVYLI